MTLLMKKDRAKKEYPKLFPRKGATTTAAVAAPKRVVPIGSAKAEKSTLLSDK